MANNTNFWRSLLQFVIQLLSSNSKGSNQSPKPRTGSRPTATLNPQSDRVSARNTSSNGNTNTGETSEGQLGDARTIEIEPPGADQLTISYAPKTDGDPDAGEVVWTWVPYEENDGRGKDRPVLVIGRQSAERVYVVRLTSKSHDGDRDFLSIGSGKWDQKGRESWVDIDQVYTVHRDGMRREAASLDLKRFSQVAQALVNRYGWKVAGA